MSQQLVCRPPGKSVGGPLDQDAALPSSFRSSGPFPLYQAKEPTQLPSWRGCWRKFRHVYPELRTTLYLTGFQVFSVVASASDVKD